MSKAEMKVLAEYQQWLRFRFDMAESVLQESQEAQEIFKAQRIAIQAKQILEALDNLDQIKPLFPQLGIIRTFIISQLRWASLAERNFLKKAIAKFSAVEEQLFWLLEQDRKREFDIPYCRGKRKIKSNREAKIILARTTYTRRKKAEGEANKYYCRKCRAWHLTKQGRRGKNSGFYYVVHGNSRGI